MYVYKISCPNPLNHLVHISLQFRPLKSSHQLEVCLPLWRPGRYELANYAKNILQVESFDENGTPLRIRKTEKSKWEVTINGASEITINYKYFAYTMDAGNSWLHDDQLYLNPINCLMYLPDRLYEEVEIELDVPENYKIACSLRQEGKKLFAKDYYEAADSPLIASPLLQHLSYTVDSATFHLWYIGEIAIETGKLLEGFSKFTKEQVKFFGGFPENDYHFLFQFLPYPHYHGVEHTNSTVITIGPGTGNNTDELYDKLMGISSHELFHAWNVTRIRPAALFPYNFSKETYFDTGFVAEGFTTYYGDLMLARGGVFDLNWLLKTLNQLLKRHYLNLGRLNLSVAASSVDLWLDGYVAGIPNRKGSIYIEGAVTALMLDLLIRLQSNGQHSLDNIVLDLWELFWKKGRGYRKSDIMELAEKYAGQSMDDFFAAHIDGVAPSELLLKELAPAFGLNLTEKLPDALHERVLGFRLKTEAGKLLIAHVHPKCRAYSIISSDDELLAVNGETLSDAIPAAFQPTNEIVLKRGTRTITLKLSDSGSYYTWFELSLNPQASYEELARLSKWAGDKSVVASGETATAQKGGSSHL